MVTDLLGLCQRNAQSPRSQSRPMMHPARRLIGKMQTEKNSSGTSTLVSLEADSQNDVDSIRSRQSGFKAPLSAKNVTRKRAEKNRFQNLLLDDDDDDDDSST